MARRTSEAGIGLLQGRPALSQDEQEVDARVLGQPAIMGMEADPGREGPTFMSTTAEPDPVAPPIYPVAPPERVVSDSAPPSKQVEPTPIMPTPSNDDPKQSDIEKAGGYALSFF